METLNLEEAAKFLNMHPVSVQMKARAGEIPGAKPGKCWTFVKADLVTYLRSLYAAKWRTLQGDNMEISSCHFTSAMTPQSGGFDLPTTDDEYSKVLALPTPKGQKSTRTS